MKFVKITALVLCAALMTSLFAGCDKKDTPADGTNSPDVTISPDVTSSPEVTAGGIDFAAAYAHYAPETVMMTVSGYDVTWEELFFYLGAIIDEATATESTITDWNATREDGMTNAEYILNAAEYEATMYKLVDYGAEKSNVTLSAANKELLRQGYEDNVTAMGSEEDLLAYLRGFYCNSKELYTYIMSASYLINDILASMYGVSGELVTDAEVADYTEGFDYYMVKHILMLTTTEGTEQEIATKNAEIYAKMEDVLAKLDSFEGGDLEAYFDSLMHELSEDGGLAGYPNGYLFQNGDMMPEFYEECVGLEIGEYGGIVETSYGYHILLRIPLNYDVVPRQLGEITPRQYVAQLMFAAVMDVWESELVVEYSDEFEALDMAKVFAPVK